MYDAYKYLDYDASNEAFYYQLDNGSSTDCYYRMEAINPYRTHTEQNRIYFTKEQMGKLIPMIDQKIESARTQEIAAEQSELEAFKAEYIPHLQNSLDQLKGKTPEEMAEKWGGLEILKEFLPFTSYKIIDITECESFSYPAVAEVILYQPTDNATRNIVKKYGSKAIRTVIYMYTYSSRHNPTINLKSTFRTDNLRPVESEWKMLNDAADELNKVSLNEYTERALRKYDTLCSELVAAGKTDSIDAMLEEKEDLLAYAKVINGILERNKSISDACSEYNDIHTAYSSYLNGLDLHWDQAQKNGHSWESRLKDFEEIQNKTLQFIKKRKTADGASSKIRKDAEMFKDILSSYNQFVAAYDSKWEAGRDGSTFDGLIEYQSAITQFIEKKKEVFNLNDSINAIAKSSKSIYKAYQTYYANADQSLPADANTSKLENIITVQKETYAILSDPSIKDIDKQVKKAKLSDINDIIQVINQNYTPVTASVEVETSQTKNESEPGTAVKTVTAAKERKIKESGSKNGGYGQYVDLTGLWDFQDNGSGVSVNVNYIGGYRFNKNIFLGLGTGISINDQNGNYYEHKTTSASGTELGYDITYFPHSFMSIPIYLHFRTDFGKGNRSWNPYISLSAGYHMSIAPIGSAVPGDFWEDWDKITEDMPEYREITNTSNGGLMGEVNFGMNCRLNEKMGMYFGIGFRAESRKESLDISTGGASGNGAVPAYSTRLSIGLSF